MWGAPSGDIFAVGEAGTIVTEARGGSFSPIFSSSQNELTAVWGFDADDVAAVGWNNSRNDQGGAVFLPQPNGGWAGGGSLTVGVNGVWGSDVDADIYAVGMDKGTILHSTDFVRWRVQDSGGITQSLWAVRGNAGDDAYAVGDGGTILHNDGSGWSKQSSGLKSSLFGVWSTPTDVWVVGAGRRHPALDGRRQLERRDQRHHHQLERGGGRRRGRLGGGRRRHHLAPHGRRLVAREQRHHRVAMGGVGLGHGRRVRRRRRRHHPPSLGSSLSPPKKPIHLDELAIELTAGFRGQFDLQPLKLPSNFDLMSELAEHERVEDGHLLTRELSERRRLDGTFFTHSPMVVPS